MQCWNCLTENSNKSHRCSNCEQPLKPNAAQSISSRRNVEYLLREIETWEFLNNNERDKVREVYLSRQGRLAETNNTSKELSAEWPESDWKSSQTPPTDPETVKALPVSTPVPIEEPEESEPQPAKPPTLPSIPAQAVLAPEPTQPSKFKHTYLESVLGEADIRWFHSLGALLVVAAVVGWLRASWFSYGRTLTGVLIALSPMNLHYIAHRLKKSVPLSSRLLAILANVLTPPALLAIDIFGALPPEVPSHHYWTFSLLISAAILSWQAHSTKEKIPLYIGALCAVTAGWPQGALATAAFSLGLGFLFSKKTDSDDDAWNALRQQVSFYGGSFGAITTLMIFETGQNPLLPISAFTAALVFLHLPNLRGQAAETGGVRVALQIAITIIGSLLMRSVLGLSPGGVALYLLFATSLFLRAETDEKTTSTQIHLASCIGLMALVIGFFSDFINIIEAQQSGLDAGLRFLFSLLSAAYFGKASRTYSGSHDNKSFQTVALCSLLGGWIHILYYFLYPEPISTPSELVPLAFSLPIFYLIVLVGSHWLREGEKETVSGFLFPLLGASLVLSSLSLLSDQANSWKSVLLAHGLFSLAWERGWLSKKLPQCQVRKILDIGLPRFTVAALLLSVPRLNMFTAEQALVLAITGLVVSTYILRSHYRKACWEAAWVLAPLSFLIIDNSYLTLVVSGLTIVMATSVVERKTLGLGLSSIFGVIALTFLAQDLAFFWLYVPAALFAMVCVEPGRKMENWTDIGPYRVGFDLLLATAVLLQTAPTARTLGSLTLCTTLAALAAAFQKFHTRPYAKRFLSAHSGLSLLLVTYLWTLSQSTLESGLIMTLAGISLALLAKIEHKLEFCNGLLILGVAQLGSQEQFLFDPTLIALGVLASIAFVGIRKLNSPHISSLAVIIIAFTQEHHSLWPELVAPSLLTATLVLSLRLLHQNLTISAAIGAFLALMKIDELAGGGDLDFKLRVIPTACFLLVASVWKCRDNQHWTRPTLYSGLGLFVVPALLQFVIGMTMLENFIWLLVTGSMYVALSFAVPKDFGPVFRQAGGYTLAAWAAVSLTRAALQLPWQAATLVIGLALVGVGIYVEKNRRAS